MSRTRTSKGRTLFDDQAAEPQQVEERFVKEHAARTGPVAPYRSKIFRLYRTGSAHDSATGFADVDGNRIHVWSQPEKYIHGSRH